MGVPLQLILGLLLALQQCSTSKTPKLRQIREAPPPSPVPIQNVTEINNRDLNKIVKDNPKTEVVDSKAKFVNNVHSYEELPLRLSKNENERQNNANNNETGETESSKEDFRKNPTKVLKEKHRDDNSRAIGINASKFWPLDFHTKNVFTLPPAPDIEKFQEPPDFALEGTRHTSFETQAELTTPITKIFDQKFKETVESVEQNIDDENDETESEGERSKDVEISVEDLSNKSENDSLTFLKTKAIVNNETVDKNSIHKDVNFEQTKKVNYENVFKDTKVYGEETTKGESFEQSSTERVTTSTARSTSTATTRKSSLLKESLSEKNNAHILSNNIETETTKPIKGIVTSTIAGITEKYKGELNNIIITSATASEKTTTKSHSTTATSTTITSTTVPLPLLKINISDQENNVIPLHFSVQSTPIPESFPDRLPITENLTTPENNDKQKYAIETRLAINSSTESYQTTGIITSTEGPETTTPFDSTQEMSDGTTIISEEGTTIFIIENSTETSDTTTEMSTTTEGGTTITTLVEMITTDSGYRTSKSLENSIVTEQLVKVNEISLENSTKEMDTSTESTVRNEIDSTTVNGGRNVEFKFTNNFIEKTKDIIETTTEEVVSTSVFPDIEVTTVQNTEQSMLVNVTTRQVPSDATTEVEITTYTTEKVPETTSESMLFNRAIQNFTKPSESTTEKKTTINTIVKVPERSTITTEIKTTTQKDKSQPTTTEYVFVHIENTGDNHTTLLPEILSPNLNYSTTVAVDSEANKIRKVTFDGHGTSLTESSSSSTTTTTTTATSKSITTQEPSANVSLTTEDATETSTENSFSQDSGGDKGKIAAIVISSVGAVCLVLLAGLLYVMKKRQKRLNYGPRCRPVSLDDYSIDNLSVYNSVRRKGGARISKRSFGNPAFDDPVAPTHPLNFPALAKFSTNLEDIKAEFEEIPQISARTSELPDGCETKNRYANVIPLPETRVFLAPIDGYPNSDYINANYVTGPKNIKGYYIATQGPMHNTVDDFWRMIWEQQAKVILMLTHLVENGLEKCVDYLPESEIVDCSRLFGDFQIILKKQEVKDKYIISTLQLKNMVSNSWREVTHFWYLGWPEKGVPAEGNSLIAFLIEARSYMKTATIDKRDAINGFQNGGAQNEHNPVVVHCSPGTGRTGVAIACDIAIREFETTRLVDIPKIVYRIRRDRAAAVQTKEQYMFIYKVVSLYATKLTGEALENF